MDDDTVAMLRIPTREALIDRLVAGVVTGHTVTLVRGAQGIGKTTVLQAAAAQLRRLEYLVVVPDLYELASVSITKAILGEAGLDGGSINTPLELFDCLSADRQLGRVLILLDDVDGLSGSAFNYLTLLLKASQAGSLKLQIIVFGALGTRPGLVAEDLGLPEDVVSTDIISPLSEAEATDYVRAKFPNSGSPALTQTDLTHVLEQADGIPARLDVLAASAIARKTVHAPARDPIHARTPNFRLTRRNWTYIAAVTLVTAATAVIAVGALLDQLALRSTAPSDKATLTGNLFTAAAPAPGRVTPDVTDGWLRGRRPNGALLSAAPAALSAAPELAPVTAAPVAGLGALSGKPALPTASDLASVAPDIVPTPDRTTPDMPSDRGTGRNFTTALPFLALTPAPGSVSTEPGALPVPVENTVAPFELPVPPSSLLPPVDVPAKVPAPDQAMADVTYGLHLPTALPSPTPAPLPTASELHVAEATPTTDLIQPSIHPVSPAVPDVFAVAPRPLSVLPMAPMPLSIQPGSVSTGPDAVSGPNTAAAASSDVPTVPDAALPSSAMPAPVSGRALPNLIDGQSSDLRLTPPPTSATTTPQSTAPESQTTAAPLPVAIDPPSAGPSSPTATDVARAAPGSDPGTAEQPRRPVGLVLMARNGDTMPSMYAKVYRGLKPPLYADVLALNHLPIRPGDMIVFPEPLSGWPAVVSAPHVRRKAE